MRTAKEFKMSQKQDEPLDDQAGLRSLLEGDIRPPLKLLLEYYMDHGARLKEASKEGSDNLITVTYNNKDLFFRSTNKRLFLYLNPEDASKLTLDKFRTHEVLQSHGINTPQLEIYKDEAHLEEFIGKAHKIAIKPCKGSGGEGVAIVDQLTAAKQAVGHASAADADVVLQEYVNGDDYRLLFVGYKLVAAIKQVKPFVIGDGDHNVEQLIPQENKRRLDKAKQQGFSSWRKHRVSQISIEAVARQKGQSFLRTVPASGQRIEVLGTANISTGALCEDVTDKVGPSIAQKCSKFLEDLGITLCGVDVISEDIADYSTSYVIELNSEPGFLPHERPEIGQPQPVGEIIAEEVYEGQLLV